MATLYFKIGADWDNVVRLRNEISKLETQLKNFGRYTPEQEIKRVEARLGEARQEFTRITTEAAKAGAAIDNDFKRKIFDASKVVNSLTERIISQKNVIKDIEADVRRLGEAYRSALKNERFGGRANNALAEYNAARKALEEEKSALFALTQERATAQLSVKKLRDEYRMMKDDSSGSTEILDEMTNKLKGWGAALLGGIGAKEFIGQMVRVRGEFQAADTAIRTLLGSKDEADALMERVRKYAMVSPLEFSDLTKATQMMLGFNIEAEKVPRFLEAIGDASMGDAQKFNSLTLAFSQVSAAGKLMGQDLNQMINAGFNPLQQISEKTGKSISELKDEMSKGAVSAEMVQQAFIDATSAGGRFYNMSENASKTINGQLSMMSDAMDKAFNEMGEKSEGLIMGGIKAATSLINNYETIGKVLVGLIATYGTYKASLLAVMAIERLRNGTLLSGIAATKAYTVAQAALNAVMKANPYVLFATALVGIGTAMWALRDSTTEAEKAQSKLSDSVKEFEKESLTELGTLASLKGELSALTKGTDEYNEVKGKIVKQFGKYYECLDEEIEKVGLTEEAYNKLTDAINRSFGARQYEKFASQQQDELSSTMSENLSNIQERLYERLGDKEGARVLSKIRDSVLNNKLTLGKGLFNIRGLDKDVSDALDKVAGKDGGGLFDVQNRSVEKYISNIVKAQKIADEMDKKARERFGVGEDYKSGGNDETKGDKTVESETYKEAYKDAQENWKAKIKALKDAENGTKAEYTKAKKELEDAEKAYKDLGGDTTGKSAKASYKESEKQIEQQQKLSDDLLAIQRKNRQDEINLMEEGTEKKLAQIRFDYDAQKQEIEKQARELAKANKEAGITDVNAKGLTYDQQENINKASDINIRRMNESINDLYKSGIDKYQSYTGQRIAIEKKFNDDIALLQEARRRAEENGNADEISKIDRSIAKATSERGKELMKHDLDVLKQSPEYIRAFEDLKNTSSETLNSLLNQLENAKQAAAQTLNPEDLREYTTTIQEIMDELDSRNPFKALADRQRELAEAEKELAEAKKQLDSVNKGAKIVTGINIGDDGKLKPTYLSAADALDKYNKAKDKHQKSNNKFVKAEKEAIDKVDELSNAIKGLGGAIGGQAGEIISIMGDVALFATTTIDGIGKVSQAGANAISAVEKASVILGIISTAIQLLQKISELGNNKAFKQYEAYAEKIKEINALTDAVNEYRIASLEARQAEENWFSEDRLKELRDYKKVHDEVFQAYVDKAGEAQAVYQNQSGGGWLTGALNWAMGNLSVLSFWDKWKNIWGQGGYDKGTTAAINNLRIETRKKSSGFLGTGIGAKSQKTEDLVSWARENGLGELFDEDGLINKELAQSIIDNYGNKLVGQTKETLEALIGLREQYDEYINQLHEYVSSLYEPLVDNFVDSLWDWFDNGKDALDSFKEYASDTFRDIVSDMMRTIVLDKVVGSFSDDIAALYEEYAKGNIDESELMKKISERTSGLVDSYEDNLPVLQGIMNQVTGYLQGAGIDMRQPESMSQQASSKGFETMSQDTGNELNGRFTALQASGEEIKNLTQITNEWLARIYAEMAPGAASMPDVSSEKAAMEKGQTNATNVVIQDGKLNELVAEVVSMRSILDEVRTINANGSLERASIAEGVSVLSKNSPKILAAANDIKRNTD